MDEKEISGLIRSAIPEAAIPEMELRKKAYAKLEDEIRAKKTAPIFPSSVLVGLTVLMGAAALWAVGQILVGGDNVLLGGVVVTVGLNVVFLPVAAAVIVINSWRRDHV